MLVNSCSIYQYDLEYHDFNFQNFRQFKIDHILEYLRNSTDEIIMYTDALDSWFLRDDVLKVYKKYFKNKVVISANRDHYPVSDLYTDFPETDESSFKFICSSQFIGERKKLIALFETMQQAYAGYVDQEAWHLLKAKGLADFEIDHKCRLFLNMTQVSADELTDDWMLKETKVRPCSIHFGGAKGDSPNAIMMREMYQKWLQNPPCK